MKFEETSAYSLRAEHCAHQADLAEDAILKKYWDDLADDWLALNRTMPAAGSARTSFSFAGQKQNEHA